MLGSLGAPELLILLAIVLLLFGGAKLPQMMKGLGQGMREFKKATHDDDEVATTTTTTKTTPSDPTNRTQV